ncbi:hypothetical protein V2W45_1224835, partial [Cenococcum geophilum]
LYLITTLLYAAGISIGHIYIGNPRPFKWNKDVNKLIMPLNGDLNHYGPS